MDSKSILLETISGSKLDTVHSVLITVNLYRIRIVILQLIDFYPHKRRKVAVIYATLLLDGTRWKLESRVEKNHVNRRPMTVGRLNGAMSATSAVTFNKQ